MNSTTKPFLRWAGSKRKLLPKLLEYWDIKFDRYVEPFMGSACLFFAITPDDALLNDLNAELVEAFNAVKTNYSLVYDELRKLPLGKDAYYAIRDRIPGELGKYERAARFIYLNRYCFNGLYRTNSAGKFNVPYSATKTGTTPTKEALKGCSVALKGKEITSLDFETLLRRECKAGDFVYLDPPFAVSNRRIFKQYGPQNFGNEDILRLRECLEYLDSIGATFVLSYAYCKESIENFSDWTFRRVTTQRNISGFANNRRRAVEVLVSNIQ